jgi:hypothetical protein
MKMHIEISERTFKRLQERSEPLVDTPESVIIRLLDNYETKTTHSSEYISSRKQEYDLRGLQRELWDLVISQMPLESFTLQDIYAREEPLVKRRPNVKDLRASIREALQKLRNKGYIEFVNNNGKYRRLI